MLKDATGALALVLLAVVAQAQPAHRVADVSSSPGSGSNPGAFTSVAGVTYFVARDEANGYELWRTDGTTAGTRILRDLFPGSGSSYPSWLTDFGGVLYFTADGSLWRSNGTALGTVRVRPDLDDPAWLVVHEGRLYFTAVDALLGRELFRTDGTDAGTELVKDIRQGPGDSDPQSLVEFGSLLYFSANGPGGRELWRSDGTEAGTLQIWDIQPGPGSSYPFGLTAAGTMLYFEADDGVHGYEPWATSLTSGLTALVSDVRPGSSGSSPAEFVAFGGAVYFSAADAAHGYELWRTDGTAAGTSLVFDARPGPGSSFPTELTAGPGALHFAASAGNTQQLWRTDGTAAGTWVVDPGARSPGGLRLVDGILYFSADDATHGRELWTSDGTNQGTTAIDLRPGPIGSSPKALAEIGGRLYFGAAPPDSQDEYHFGEPWTSDGTSAGSSMLKEIGSGGSSRVYGYARVGGVSYFAANDGVRGLELWRSDGTESGTFIVKDLLPGVESSYPSEIVVLNGVLYFVTAHDGALWRSDGTDAGTVHVTGAGHPLLQATWLCVSGGFLYFRGTDAAAGNELWRTDGTAAGTVLVRDIHPGVESGQPSDLTDVNGTVFFAARDAAEGVALWKSDGTTSGTVLVDPILPGPQSAFPRHLTVAGGLLFFAADDGLHGDEPWVSDGTNPGTRQVRDVRGGPFGSYAGSFAALGNTVFFHAHDGVSGYELWRSDGTEPGTVRVQDIRPGPEGSAPRIATAVGGSILFVADDGTHGEELWRTDLAASGATQVRDILPGRGGALHGTYALAKWGGWAYFAADTEGLGQELGRSDGTFEGTTLVQDIAPGPASSSPEPLGHAGGLLFFTAVDAAGREPWVLRPELAVANATAAEGTHALVDVSLIPRLDVPLAVPFATADNSAVGGSDFLPKSGVLTFAPGETLQTVDVTVLDDVTHEPVEQFFVDVAPGPSAFASRPRGIVTVTDDDPAPAVTVDDASVVEGDSVVGPMMTFTVRLAPVSAMPVTVAYVTLHGTAEAKEWDYGPVSGTLTFAPGESAQAVTVRVYGDVKDEPDETFFLRASTPAGEPLAHGLGRILDDDGAAIRLAALDRGGDVLASLEAAGPAPDEDLYVVEQQPFASYEVTVDGSSGDVGDEGPQVELLSAGLQTVAASVASGVGHARSLRFANPEGLARYVYVRVRSLGCSSDCGADDTYRIRLRETTGRLARFNDVGGARTLVVLQNRGDATIEARVSYWEPDGAQLGTTVVTLPPRGSAVLATPAIALGDSGSITLTHDGPQGTLAGKAVTLDPATGLTFDTPLETRPR